MYSISCIPSIFQLMYHIFQPTNLVRRDVGEGVLRSVLHEDAHRRPDPDALGVQPTGQSVGQLVHLSERERVALYVMPMMSIIHHVRRVWE